MTTKTLYVMGEHGNHANDRDHIIAYRCCECNGLIYMGDTGARTEGSDGHLHEGCYVRRQVLFAAKHGSQVAVERELLELYLGLINISTDADNPEQTRVLRSGAAERHLVVHEEAHCGGYSTESWHRRILDGHNEILDVSYDVVPAPTPPLGIVVMAAVLLLLVGFVCGLLWCQGFSLSLPPAPSSPLPTSWSPGSSLGTGFARVCASGAGIHG